MNTMINQTAIWSTRKMFQCFLDHGANVSRFSNEKFLVQNLNIVTRSNLYRNMMLLLNMNHLT